VTTRDRLDALVLSGKLDCLTAGTVRELRAALADSPREPLER
jgi:hypothetical protein